MKLSQRASLALLLSWLTAPPAAALGGDVVVDAGRGPVTVHVPSSYDPADPVPLLVLLHGYSGNGNGLLAYFGIASLADQLGIAYMAPNGTTDSQGLRFWNATDACCNFDGSAVDDSSYLRALIDAAKLGLSVDPTRVHVGGHSNGGFMSYRMACDHSEAIASIASLAGATWEDPADCTPDQPVHVLQIHGTADPTISYGGGNILGVPYPGAVESVEQWASFGDCSASWTPGAPLDLVNGLAGQETTVRHYETACSSGGSGELWSVTGGNHGPNFNATFDDEVLGWLLAHPKPEVSANYCSANDHSGGRSASIVAVGSPSVADEDLRLIGHGAPPGVTALFIASNSQNSIPFGDGFLCVAGPIRRLPPAVVTTAGGDAFRTLDFDAGYGTLFTAGAQVNFQLWFRDLAAGGAGFNTSDGCSLTMTP